MSVSSAVYAHAAILSLIHDTQPEWGRKLHDMGRNKQMTLALLPLSGQAMLLRLTFIAGEGLSYATTIVNALSAKPRLRLGAVVYAVDEIALTGSPWTRISTWADLLDPSPHRSMRIEFVTPSAITKKDDRARRFTSLYPEPRDVFAGLARRWQALDGPPLPPDLPDFVQRGGCVVANHNLHTVEFYTAERTQIGFVGHVVYECRQAEQEYVLAVNALGRFAFFAGVGYQTMRGMGAVCISLNR
ncbi:MAG: CRISPR system precrRNA processing endoribonuclease RAMP protein Cas6 [Chloroflexota bacterium]|nr:CRISPR system precrRNA processing endoribonuclease RAMP protein Cas6 [Chloroflexota bacterium]